MQPPQSETSNIADAPLDLQLSLPSTELLDRTESAVSNELERDRSAAHGGATTNCAGLEKLSILMPVYNERWTVGDVLARVLETRFPLPVEIVVIDDGSRDGSAEVVAAMAAERSEIRLVRQPENRGKGAAIRRGISEMTGDVAVIQDADLEYDPADLPRLLTPILEDRADAVFGSRFAGSTRKCLSFWHGQINRALTLASNMLTDINLSDMETGYKVVRSDILKNLRLRSNTFTLEPELTCRLSQWGARIYEAPISYHGRSFEEGKKIRPRDGLKALLTMFRCRFLDTQFATQSGRFTVRRSRGAARYNRFVLDAVRPYLGHRLIEAGAGMGHMSSMLLNRQRLVLVDSEGECTRALGQRFAGRSNVRVEQIDLMARDFPEIFTGEQVDTIVCVNGLAHVASDYLVLRNFYKTIIPRGHCIVVVPSDPRRMGPPDDTLGQRRRHQPEQLPRLMEQVGFEVVMTKAFNRAAAILGRRQKELRGPCRVARADSRRFDRLAPLPAQLDRYLPLPAMSQIIVARKP